MKVKVILAGKCPVCEEGEIFHTFWRMHANCPACGIHFHRESGYFSMSIFLGYILAGILALPFIGLALILRLGIWGVVGLP